MAYTRAQGKLFVPGRASALAVAALLSLTGCNSQRPLATNFPNTYQPVVESAGHWQQIASEIWDQVNGTLEAAGYHETTIGLESPVQQTQFTKALDGFLFSEAVNHSVSVTPDAPFTISYAVQMIHYEPLAGETAIVSSTGNDGWSDSENTTEMILTISVTDGSSVRIRQSKVFYIDDADTSLYEVSKTSAADNISNSPLVSSNWYSANPHEVEPIARRDANSFALMVDPKAGPIHTVNEATPVAAAHCAKAGMAQAKYLSESYPTNDRSQIRLQYECM